MTQLKRAWILMLVLGAGLMVSAPAWACTVWTTETGAELHLNTDEPIVYYIQADGSADIPDQSDFDAIEAAFDAWSSITCGDQGSGLVFQFGGVIEFDPINFDPRRLRDRRNIVTFINEDWEGDPQVLARARLLWNSDTGEVEEFGIALNDQFADWATDGNPMAFDVQAVLMRQIGLVFGLGNSTFESSVMFPGFEIGSTRRRTLGNDDVAAVCDLYAPGREDYSQPPEDAVCDREFHPGARPDEPGNNDPGNNEPGNNDPGNNEPGNNEPGNNEPGNNEPGNNEPGDVPPQDLGSGENCTGDSQCAEGLVCGCPLESCVADICFEPAADDAGGDEGCATAPGTPGLHGALWLLVVGLLGALRALRAPKVRLALAPRARR